MKMPTIDELRRYHTDNPGIYQEFEKEALRIAEKRNHYSARTIMEFIRHHRTVSAATETEPFKVNNNQLAYYARLFRYRNPYHATLFEYRRWMYDGHNFTGSYDYIPSTYSPTLF